MGTAIKISIRELEVIAQKALEGLGVTSGLDQDGAHAVVWCESRGLNGIKTLLSDLNALSGIPIRKTFNIDARGLSALSVAPLVIDLVIAADQSFTVYNIQSPFVAIAYAVRRACGEQWFKLMWDNSGALVAKGKASIFCTELSISKKLIIISGKGTPTPISSVAISAVELEKRYQRALNDGLLVEKRALESLLALANQVLVPASKQSRSSAGAEVDDNE